MKARDVAGSRPSDRPGPLGFRTSCRLLRWFFSAWISLVQNEKCHLTGPTSNCNLVENEPFSLDDDEQNDAQSIEHISN